MGKMQNIHKKYQQEKTGYAGKHPQGKERNEFLNSLLFRFLKDKKLISVVGKDHRQEEGNPIGYFIGKKGRNRLLLQKKIQSVINHVIH